jgi:putative addiction module component (TIGR02574 family)
MAIDLSSEQLDALSAVEKVRLLEQVWQSLSGHPDSFPSPQWHADILDDRRQRLLDGTATPIAWEDAKAQLQRLAE